MSDQLDMDAIRGRLRDAFEASGKSMRAVSKEAGLGAGFFSAVLNEGKVPSVVNLASICDTLGVSMSQVLQGIEMSREAEEIIQLLDRNPEKRQAILQILRS